MKPQPWLGVKRQLSRESFGDMEHVDSVSDQEKRRQEAINEAIYAEHDSLRDMGYLRDVWIAHLGSARYPEHRRADSIEQAFWNIHNAIAVNTRLRDALNKRHKSYAVIGGIADIFRDNVPLFAPLVSYGAHRLYENYGFEKQKSSNPAFA